MASSTAEQHIRSRHLFQVWDHDPGGTGATVVTPDGGTTERWVDMKEHEYFAAIAITTVLAGNGITKLEIVAADDTAGTNVTVVKDSGTIAADALADWAIEECSADEVAQLSSDNGYSLRYVAARLTVQNAGDEAIVVYFTYPKRKYLDRTPATTIA